MMIISTPKITENDAFAEVSACITIDGAEYPLWFRVDRQFAHMLSDRADAFLAGLLIPAMARGEDLQIEGALSPRMLYGVKGQIREMLRHMQPRLKAVAVEARTLSEKQGRGAGVISGFSCGVDSLSALYDHFVEPISETYRLTHLFFTDVGAHGAMQSPVFQDRVSIAKAAAEKIGLPLIVVSSNLDTFYERGAYVTSHTLRNLAAALVLQNGVGAYLYSSGQHFRGLGVKQNKDISITEPALLPMMSTQSFDAISVGNQHHRINKVQQIADWDLAQEFLDVCVLDYTSRTPRNCGHCYKCMRTMLALKALGKLDRFEHNFDMDAYRRSRVRHVLRSELRNDVFWIENEACAKANDQKFPADIRAAIAVIRLPGVKWIANRIWRAVRVMRGLPPEPFGFT
ncbi:MAG: hypothetical protein AAGD92_16530 [Pseudomonadota bacterium]